MALSCVGAAPGTCSVSPSSLVPTASGAAFTVTVGNTTSGVFNFSVQGTDGTLTHSQAVSLTVGTDVTWSDTGSTTVTVQAGQTATYSFSAAPVGGGTFSSAVTFACANLPTLTTCSFSPLSIAAGAGTTAVTATISTTGPNSGSGSDRRQPILDISGVTGGKKVGVAWTWLTTIPIAGIFLAGIARGRMSRRGGILGGSIALAALLLLAACGGLGGGGGQPPPQVTVTVSPGVPPSVYPNSSGWPPQTAQFTATVANASNTAVTWAVTTPTGGTIDPSGLYTAPTVAAGLPATVTITATSQADTTKSGTNHETLNPATIPGSYSGIQVTATAAGGTAHADSVTLNVD